MYFFDKLTIPAIAQQGQINAGYWQVGGLDHIAIHVLLHGTPGTSGYFLIYFNNMQAYDPQFTLDAGGLHISTYRYPVLGPEMSINIGCNIPGSIHDGQLHIYGACCSPDWKSIRRL